MSNYRHFRRMFIYAPDQPDVRMFVYVGMEVIAINLSASPHAKITRLIFN